jgi:hypothetical protein
MVWRLEVGGSMISVGQETRRGHIFVHFVFVYVSKTISKPTPAFVSAAVWSPDQRHVAVDIMFPFMRVMGVS